MELFTTVMLNMLLHIQNGCHMELIKNQGHIILML